MSDARNGTGQELICFIVDDDNDDRRGCIFGKIFACTLTA